MAMAFVNELIPEEEKARFTFPVWTLRSGSKPTLYKWTIDRERDAYLVHAKSVGGAYEGTPEEYHFVLNWRGTLIKFVGISKKSGNMEEGYVILWRILQLEIPKESKGDSEYILVLIREALDVMGFLYKRTRISAVNVNFDLMSSDVSNARRVQ